ncbi:uncharacterized protein PHACADRAFT_266031, partial [Phanerochaete carnosa HHB-10118-sp]
MPEGRVPTERGTHADESEWSLVGSNEHMKHTCTYLTAALNDADPSENIGTLQTNKASETIEDARARESRALRNVLICVVHMLMRASSYRYYLDSPKVVYR